MSLVSFVSSRFDSWRMDGYVRLDRCLLTWLHAAAVTKIPVCLLYPWPWWQANKTPGPAYKTSTILWTSIRPVITTITTGPLIRPLERINDFILPDGRTLCRRGTSRSLASITDDCSFVSWFSPVTWTLVLSRRGIRARMKPDRIYRAAWFILNYVSTVEMYVERVLLLSGRRRVTRVFLEYAMQ